MFRKQRLTCLLLITGLLSGCGTAGMRMSPRGVPSAIARFEQAKGLSCSELAVLYDISRLKTGSSAKLKLLYGKSSKPYFETLTLREIKPVNTEKKYIIDITSGRTSYALEGSALAFNRVICSDSASIKDYYLKRDNSAFAIVKSAGGGVLGIAMELIERAQEPEKGREMQGMESAKVETKIIDFKFITQETLRISNRLISCRVYAIQSIARETISPMKHAPASTSIIEERKKVWISDEVPFGLVKSESDKIMNMEMPGMGWLNMGQNMTESCEVAEFSY